MKQLIILITIFLVPYFGFSQKIVVNSIGLYVNSHHVTKEFSKDSVIIIFGEPSGKYFNNSRWTYDDLGMSLRFGETKILEDIEISFIAQDYDFSPKHSFKGELEVFNVKLSRETPLKKVRKIEELKFEENYFFNVFNARVNNLVLTFDYLDSVAKLNAISISQGSHELLDLIKALQDSTKR